MIEARERVVYVWSEWSYGERVCKASDSEHEIVMTNKEDFMGRNEY